MALLYTYMCAMSMIDTECLAFGEPAIYFSTYNSGVFEEKMSNNDLYPFTGVCLRCGGGSRTLVLLLNTAQTDCSGTHP